MEENSQATQEQQNIPIPTQPPILKKQPKLFFRFTKPIIIGLFALVLLITGAGATYFIFGSNEGKAVPPPETTTTPTPSSSSWKTYENAEYGFSFTYPTGWEVNKEDGNGLLSISPDAVPRLYGEIIPSDNANEYIVNNYSSEYLINYTTKTIDNPKYRITEYTFSYDSNAPAFGPSEEHIVLIEGGRKFYFRKYGIEENIFDQILSTFEFTDSNPSCTPRPACLDTEPRCLIPETPDMCLPLTTPAQIQCTADAKLCPDGSAVGRTGPDCEFAACPGE